MERQENNQANEEISKFKLLSAYGGPGSIVHTAYGSILISSIEEWGFLQRVKGLRGDAIKLKENEIKYVVTHAALEDIYFSNDERLLNELIHAKGINNLKYLVLLPNLELNEAFNTIKDGKTNLAINSTFMPKGFLDNYNNYKKYPEWYRLWKKDKKLFFPPKYISFERNEEGENMRSGEERLLKQDNIVLICKDGHISDFPWSEFLRWRIDFPDAIYEDVDLLTKKKCCDNPKIQIKETSANASGFDGKWLKCNNKSCDYSTGISLKGLMSTKVLCAGHKPWEVETGGHQHYFGNEVNRRDGINGETCKQKEPMRVALTTGNNLYFSRILSSLYMPQELFLSDLMIKIKELEEDLKKSLDRQNFEMCIQIRGEIEDLKQQLSNEPLEEVPDSHREMHYRFQEYFVLKTKTEEQLNIHNDLKVKDVTSNLNTSLKKYFDKVLRIDNLKVTSAQLDFSRVEPYDIDSQDVTPKSIFSTNPNNVYAYPVVENFGEGIFFSFNEIEIKHLITDIVRFKRMIEKERSDFATSAVKVAKEKNWQLYLVHTFCHIIMRELEFRCGYPTASLSERIYVSNEEGKKMYGCLIYTSEGAEGSMGGLISQTRAGNINNLIENALKRATVCNSDPLCWESDGQGLFELNLASCFSCSLVSETSCELRNLYLDRRILVDEEFGLFKEVLL